MGKTPKKDTNKTTPAHHKKSNDTSEAVEYPPNANPTDIITEKSKEHEIFLNLKEKWMLDRGMTEEEFEADTDL